MNDLTTETEITKDSFVEDKKKIERLEKSIDLFLDKISILEKENIQLKAENIELRNNVDSLNTSIEKVLNTLLKHIGDRFETEADLVVIKNMLGLLDTKIKSVPNDEIINYMVDSIFKFYKKNGTSSVVKLTGMSPSTINKFLKNPISVKEKTILQIYFSLFLEILKDASLY